MMLIRLTVVLGTIALSATAHAQQPPLLPEPVLAALAAEASGETAHRTVEGIALHHRTRGSRPFRASAEWVAQRAREAGLEEVRIEEFPTDGQIFYGTQRSRPAWDAEFAELWELREQGGAMVPAVRWASWDAQPMTLAQDSESAQVTAELVDVGNGTSEADYAGRDVRGKIVLAAAQPGPVARLAVARYGAVGIVSYAQNQRTAWWGQDDMLIRWGHLETFAPTNTFGFMFSLATARAFRERLDRGETIMLRADVRAGQRPGGYDLVTAKISGADARLAAEEIVFTCHLDHPRPGANDNASGCAAILEAGRTLNKLIAEGRIPRPARTLRFVWPPEIEGTLAILDARPDWARRVRAVVHMDMVGGGPETKAIFRVTRGPASLPSFVYDVGEAFGEFVNRESERFASTGAAAFPLVAPEGGREPLMALLGEFSMGSDHEVYTEGSWRIPAIYLHDWPDRYIHTTGDTPAMIDPTKLKRAAFIGAASGYFLADMGAAHVDEVQRVVELSAMRRAARTLERLGTLPPDEQAHLRRFHHAYEREVAASIDAFAPRTAEQRRRSERFVASLEGLLGRAAAAPAAQGDGRLVFRRNPELRGPMTAFGYAYLPDHLGEERTAALRLLRFQGPRGGGGEYAYEVLNLVDGRRSAADIRHAVSAIYGPVPLEYVVEYLRALEQIDVVRSGR
jgi:aminopeptidase YwaD